MSTKNTTRTNKNLSQSQKNQLRQKGQNRQKSGRKLTDSQKSQIKNKWNNMDPGKQQQVKQKAKDRLNSGNRPVKPIKPGNGNRPGNGNKPGHGNRPEHGNRPGHGHGHGHGHHGHHHYHHYPHYGWGGYWPWFWGSAIVVGAFVSTIPEDDCRDIYMDGKQYKECEGVLFEPVYQGDNVEYKVVEINK
jgi:hypothetical protein